MLVAMLPALLCLNGWGLCKHAEIVNIGAEVCLCSCFSLQCTEAHMQIPELRVRKALWNFSCPIAFAHQCVQLLSLMTCQTHAASARKLQVNDILHEYRCLEGAGDHVPEDSADPFARSWAELE